MRGRIGRILAAVVLLASAGVLSVDLAGAATSTPTFALGSSSIARGASTTFNSTFTMAEDATAQATLNLPPGITGAFDAACTATGHTCSVSAAGVVTISNELPAPVDPAVPVTITGTITATQNLPLRSAEDALMSAEAALSITLNQGASATSPPQPLTVTPNAVTDVELQIDTTGPAVGAPGPRGGTVSYTANITRVGTASALAQATTANVSLVADGSAPFVTTAPAATTVSWAANEAGAKPVTLVVTVPTDIPLGDTEAYHFVVTYDPNAAAGTATDTENGESRSFVVAAGPGDAVISITNTAPTAGQDVVRATSVTYTATLTRTGNLDQVTSVNVSLVPVGDARGTTPGAPVNVAFAIDDATETVSIPVNVPHNATLGPVSYHFRARYDASGIGAPPAAQDTVDGAAVSVDVVAAQPTFTLTPPDQTVTRGDNLTLVATLVNPPGAEPIVPGIITVNVPAGMSVNSATATPGTAVIGPAPVPLVGLVTVTYGVIEPNTTKSLTIPVTVLDSATKKPGADLAVTASFNNGVLTDSSNFEIVAEADLTLTVDPVTQNKQKGKTAVVTVEVGNDGPEDATGTKTVTITLTDNGGPTKDDAEIVSVPSSPSCTVNPAKTQAVCTITAPIGDNATVGIPIGIRSKDPLTATLTASLATTGTELDPDGSNNVDVPATVHFQQAVTDVGITAGPSPVEIKLGTPTQNVTFNVANNDPDTGADDGDAAEAVKITITIPAAVQATAATVPGGTCTVPAAPGGQVVCDIATINDGANTTITLTLQGTTLTAAPGEVKATLTSTATVDPPGDTNDSASVFVNVVKQPVDLTVSNTPDAVLRPVTPGGTTGSGNFTVTVTNNSAATYTSGPYTLTVALEGGATAAQLALSSADAACTTTGNVVTCTGTNLGATPRDFVIHGDINVRGPITVRSTVALDPSATQEDPTANNTDTWTVTRAQADLALTISPDQSIQKKKNAPVTVTLTNNGPDTATGTKVVTIDVTGQGTIQTAPGTCNVNSAKTQAVCNVTADILPTNSVEIPITVKSDNAGDVATVTATITTFAAESDINNTNNGPVSSTVTFNQSSADLSITHGSPPLSLVVQGATQNVVYTLDVVDNDPPPNAGDPSEQVRVTITVPSGVTATAVLVEGAANSCAITLPTVVCNIGDVGVNENPTVTVTLQGTTFPGGGNLTATAEPLGNNDPNPGNNAANPVVVVTVIPQPVDLDVTTTPVADALLQTGGPTDFDANDDFTVTVRNNGIFTANSYTVTIQTPAPANPGDITFAFTTVAEAGCTLNAESTVATCTGTNLGVGAIHEITIDATIHVAGPVTVEATVDLGAPSAADPQEDLNPANNEEPWAITRNVQPATQNDVAPTIPVGSRLVYNVLDNDTDDDVGDRVGLSIADAAVGGTGGTVTVTGTAGCVPTAAGRCTSLTVDVPAGANVPGAALQLTYNVLDPRGGSTPAILTVRVVPALAPAVAGSFFDPPPTRPNSFDEAVPTNLLLASNPTPIDVLGGELGKMSDGAAIPATLNYDLTDVHVSQPSPNVTGTTVTVIAETNADTPAKSVAQYVPAAGYTSARPTTDGVAQAPPDRFTYRTTGKKADNAQLFTVEASVTVEVLNQLPVTVDSLIDVPNSTTQRARPANNDIDGNTTNGGSIATKDPAGEFVFNDQGDAPDTPTLRPKILCIGQVPTAAERAVPNGGLAKCPKDGPPVDGWKGADQELVLQTPEGKVTVKLIGGNDPDAFRAMDITADATVVGRLDFAYVVADNYGGASFGKVTANVPNTPPIVIEGVRTVIKNTPTIVVDTKLATSDINGDTIEITSTSPRTEHGTAVIGDANRIITYTPDKDYLGPDKLLYNVSDGRADGAASAVLELNVIENPSEITPAGGGGTGAGAGGAGGPAGNLAATGGDPLPLTAAAGCSLVLGLLLVQAGRRRQSRPLLERARHLRT